MSWEFGSTTTDSLQFGLTNNHASGGTSLFVCGWWYPTTLTATRRLWSLAAVIGVEINTTTSELRLKTDNTTDGQWTTSGVNLTLNEWKFIAFFGTFTNTGPAAQWRVWAGTVETCPAEVTVSVAVAPVGNFVAASAFNLGNTQAGSVSWQGLIGNANTIVCSAGSLQNFPLPNTTSGTITNDEANIVFQQLVIPYWSGESFPHRVLHNAAGFSSESASINMDHANTTSGLVAIRRGAGSITPFLLGTRAGSPILSQVRTPVPRKQPENHFLRRR